MKILIIEDDYDAADFLKYALTAGWPGIQLLLAYDGTKGIELIKTETPDIVLLDLGLPDISGFDVIRKVRTFTQVPIIILTVMDNEPDMVKALELGADEYIIKPFGQMEIISRIKSFTRRLKIVQQQSQDLIIGPWHFVPHKNRLYNESYQICLTPTENTILQHLLANEGQVVTYRSIAEAVWGVEYPGSIDSIRVYISRLRQKIEKEPGYPPIIIAKLGVGYYITKTK